MPRIAADSLCSFATDVLLALGTSSEDAAVVAEHLVEANLSGHDSHGVLRLPQYAEHARTGKVKVDGNPRIERDGKATVVLDGDHAWGPVVGNFAVAEALQRAATHGIAAVSVRASHHIGRVGSYVAALAEAGHVGLAFCNVHGVARVAPWGSAERKLATNPIAIAVPRAGAPPIVCDFATSAVAEGKVRLARTAGEQIPLGWVVDSDGTFSTDPNAAYEDGALAPLGGDQGHKGFSLSIAMDLLGGVLTGAGCALMSDEYGNGFLLMALDIAAFTDPGDFAGRVADYERYIKSARLAPGAAGVLLPGEKESAERRKRLQSGIEIGQEVWDNLVALGGEFDVSLAAG